MLPDVQEALRAWQRDYLSHQITAQQLVSQTLVLMNLMIYKKRAFNKKLPFFYDFFSENTARALSKNLPQSLSPDFCHSVTLNDPAHLVASGLLTAVPQGAQEAFRLWAEGEIKLSLLFHIPSPLEVLEIQSQGQRCISLLIDEAHLRSTDQRDRDFISFLIHDLVHAHHFWKTQSQYCGQIEFYEKMKGLLRGDQLIQQALKENQFKKEFEYLISDMNSHPRHLEWTFIAQLRNWQKRSLKVSRLDLDQEVTFNTWVKASLQPDYPWQ